MQINWGRNAHGSSDVLWNSSEMINPHMGIFGDTGMGKTHTIRRIIHEMIETSEGRPPRFHIFDAHDDMSIPGDSDVRFHESADFGFNPLEINPDPEYGGIRKRIQSLIGAINRTSVRLGPRQERALSKILIGLYRDWGFVSDDPATWALGEDRKAYPNLIDAIRYAKEQLKAIYTGSNTDAVRAFEEVNRIARQIRNKQSILTGLTKDEDIARLEKELVSAKETAISLYQEAVKQVSNGTELDEALEFDGQDEVMKSLIDRLENLYAIGIYRSTPPPLDTRTPIWRYVISSLDLSEKKLFTLTRLETIFTRAVQRGKQDKIQDVLIFDEGHLYVSKDDDHIINRMGRESRKFGIAMIFATHAPADLTDDLLGSLGTKVILGVDTTHRRTLVSKLGLKESAFDFIIPRKRILVQMKKKNEANNGTYHTILKD